MENDEFKAEEADTAYREEAEDEGRVAGVCKTDAAGTELETVTMSGKPPCADLTFAAAAAASAALVVPSSRDDNPDDATIAPDDIAVVDVVVVVVVAVGVSVFLSVCTEGLLKHAREYKCVGCSTPAFTESTTQRAVTNFGGFRCF